jgi:hypothetical protein
MSDKPKYDGSGKGGDADAHYGHWHGKTGDVAAGHGTGGDVAVGKGEKIPDGSFNMSGTGGNARGNAGGGARGGDGKGGSFTFGK